ncbi:MAG: hypothetical protein RR212_08295 [Bacteroidales bacterium]
MKLYTVGFMAKNNPDDFVAPDDAYVGDNIDRAKEQAEEFRHNLKRFSDFKDKYDVCVMDKTGHLFYQQPFVKEQETPANEDKGHRREEWDKEKK